MSPKQQDSVLRDLEAIAQDVLVSYRNALDRRAEIEAEVQTLKEKFNAIAEAYQKLSGKSLRSILKLFDTVAKIKYVGPNARIGDAMQAIIEEKGGMTTVSLIEELRKRNVRLSEKNARSVIAMTIKQDKEKRFRRGEDRRIVLRKKQADAKG